jgi:WxL domain surface cell wall-binding
MRIPAFRLDGRKHEYTITIHPIQITDERSASAGWRLTAAISQFSGVGGSSFRAAAVVWAHCGWTGGTQWAAVTSGSALPLGGRPVALCSAARAEDSGIVSRLFAVSATLTVTIPAYVAAGRYSASMTFTLLARPGL